MLLVHINLTRIKSHQPSREEGGGRRTLYLFSDKKEWHQVVVCTYKCPNTNSNMWIQAIKYQIHTPKHQIQMRPGSDWELGRLLFLHIYKWCIGNFLPSQHRGLCVWLHSCNALDRSRSSTVATRAAVHKDANCTKCCCCCHVLWLQCLGKHYFSATQISVQCKMCAVHTRVVQQCSASQHQCVWEQSAGTLTGSTLP